MTTVVDKAAEYALGAATGRMRAFVMTSLDHVGFMDKPVPQPGPNDAIG